MLCTRPNTHMCKYSELFKHRQEQICTCLKTTNQRTGITFWAHPVREINNIVDHCKTSLRAVLAIKNWYIPGSALSSLTSCFKGSTGSSATFSAEVIGSSALAPSLSRPITALSACGDCSSDVLSSASAPAADTCGLLTSSVSLLSLSSDENDVKSLGEPSLSTKHVRDSCQLISSSYYCNAN